MRRGLWRWGTTVALLATVLGCEAVSPTTCTDELRPGITVEVRDSTTGHATGAGAKLLVVSGTYRDSASYSADTPANVALLLSAAYERAGIYEVIVRKSGYVAWGNTATVRRDDCHVITVRLVALLQRD